jgi:hypothetical protein
MVITEVMRMANVAKYTRGEIGGLTRHFERYQKEDGTYQQFGNQEIDTTRTHLNYNLASEHEWGQLHFIAERCGQVKCSKRDDVNVMCSWIVTAPVGLATDVTYGADDKPRLSFAGNEAELERFFAEAYKFLNQRYADGSDKNVISAYVHMDETTPHLHYAFIPVSQVKKTTPKGKKIDEERVSAKTLVCRSDLQTFHQDLEAHMAKVFGREIGILNEATRDGNKDVQTLKRERAIAEAEKALADEIKPIEGKLAGEQTISRFAGKNVQEQRRYGAVGEKGVFIAGATKADVLKIAKSARQRLTSVKQAREQAERAETEKDKAIGLAEKEIEKQRAIAKTATDAWKETLAVYKGVTWSGERMDTPEAVPKISKYYKDKVSELKPIADRVPDLEQQVKALERERATEKQQEFARLPDDMQQSLLRQGQQILEQNRQAQVQAAADEKARLMSLHKNKAWSDLTKDEKQEVRRLLVNAPEFQSRQDYLDFKRTFGREADRGAR